MNENRRVRKLRSMMDGYAEYVIVPPGTNLYYLTGLDPIGTMERPFFLVVPLDSSPFIVAPQLYENELRNTDLSLRIWK
ncbi:MAG: aminopeptidase P family N-terminal domain-containing protein, partial [Thermoplasmata archaeon]